MGKLVTSVAAECANTEVTWPGVAVLAIVATFAALAIWRVTRR